MSIILFKQLILLYFICIAFYCIAQWFNYVRGNIIILFLQNYQKFKIKSAFYQENFNFNGYIIIWILHQIFMFSDKVKHTDG